MLPPLDFIMWRNLQQSKMMWLWRQPAIHHIFLLKGFFWFYNWRSQELLSLLEWTWRKVHHHRAQGIFQICWLILGCIGWIGSHMASFLSCQWYNNHTSTFIAVWSMRRAIIQTWKMRKSWSHGIADLLLLPTCIIPNCFWMKTLSQQLQKYIHAALEEP
jgi:hypothetical protein